ncbi:hypothetical protein BC567DRAFT_210947 [Phyllosticta citribraziliensis]
MHKLSCPPFLPDLPDLEETSPMGAAAYRISPTTTNVAETTLSKMNANANVNTKGAKIPIGATAYVPVTGAVENTRATGAVRKATGSSKNTVAQGLAIERRKHGLGSTNAGPRLLLRTDGLQGQTSVVRTLPDKTSAPVACLTTRLISLIGELELTVTAQAKSIRDIRHELEQQRQQHTREIAELQRQRQEEIQQQQAHEISQLRERLERLEQQQQEHGQDMANLQEGVQDALPYVLMQQRQQQQQQQQQIQQREDKDKGEGSSLTVSGYHVFFMPAKVAYFRARRRNLRLHTKTNIELERRHPHVRTRGAPYQNKRCATSEQEVRHVREAVASKF